MPSQLDDLFRDTRRDMLASIADDLNTSGALAILARLVNYMQNIQIPSADGKYSDGTLALLDSLLGLKLDNRPDISTVQKQLIASRETARQSKDWAKSDQIRDQLRRDNLEVDDTPYGPRWRRTKIS